LTTLLVATAQKTTFSGGRGLHTPVAVPKPTQPSNLRGMVNALPAFGMSNRLLNSGVGADYNISPSLRQPVRDFIR